VFDPLALTLLLAATKTFEWESKIDLFNPNKKKEEESVEEESVESWFDRARKRARFWDKQQKLNPNDVIDESQFWIRDVENDEPVVDQPTNISPEDYYRALGLFDTGPSDIKDSQLHIDPTPPGWMFNRPSTLSEPIEQPVEEEIIVEEPTDIEPYGTDMEKHVMRMWRSQNPDKTYKQYLDDFRNGIITELPWKHIDHVEGLGLSDRDLLNLKELHLQADNEPTVGEVQGFGIEFPKTAKKGDMFLRVDNLPSQLYKYNGVQWIKVNKNLSDSYIYDDAYIDHLIEKIGSGEYDPDLLSDIERERIAEKLKNSNDLG
jgi:hypothetical protein